MKNLFRNITLLSLALMMGLSLQAQKFGYINTQELIQQYPQVKEANANIETYKSQLEKKGQEMIKALQTKYQGLERKQAQGEISPKQLEVEAQALKVEESKIAQFQQESQNKILAKSEELLKPIRDKIQAAITAVAQENNFDYIFDYSMGFILYADSSTDVNSLVKAKLGL